MIVAAKYRVNIKSFSFIDAVLTLAGYATVT